MGMGSRGERIKAHDRYVAAGSTKETRRYRRIHDTGWVQYKKKPRRIAVTSLNSAVLRARPYCEKVRHRSLTFNGECMCVKGNFLIFSSPNEKILPFASVTVHAINKEIH